jgi:hypothetical protein
MIARLRLMILAWANFSTFRQPEDEGTVLVGTVTNMDDQQIFWTDPHLYRALGNP